MAALLVLIVGCAYTTRKTTIVTPAVYNVSQQNGSWLTNVTPATTTTLVEKQPLWLAHGYAYFVEEDIYGVRFSVINPQTGNPGDIRAGASHTAIRAIPTSVGTNIFAPAFTSGGRLKNNGLPFALSGDLRFTSGNTEATQSETNAAATAIVPGVPLTQQKP